MLLRTVTLMIAIALSAAAVQAEVVDYNTEDREQWFTDVGGPDHISTVDFTGYDDFTLIDDQWAHLGVHFTGVEVTSGPGCSGYPNDCWGIEGYPDIIVTFDEPINWIAADFPGEMFIELFSGGDLIYTSGRFGLGGAGLFGGVISTQSFDSARIYREAVNVTFLDDLHFGPVIAVPAPGAILLLGSVAMVNPRRRRRN